MTYQILRSLKRKSALEGGTTKAPYGGTIH